MKHVDNGPKILKACDTRTFDDISLRGASDTWVVIHLDELFQGCQISTAKRLSVGKIKFVVLQGCGAPCNFIGVFDSAPGNVPFKKFHI